MTALTTQIQMRKSLLKLCLLDLITWKKVCASDTIDKLTKAKKTIPEGAFDIIYYRISRTLIRSYQCTNQRFFESVRPSFIKEERRISYQYFPQLWPSLIQSAKLITSQR